ncbi:MAG: helix-turn-helix domain-containing protein [Bryobacterales bacterium]|nr:helix-turn-helix domain-containing protein [Bryobacteraceae bacterium]MDW8353794.1 helix-turn-helix domain-containing protein [Bryobacterales bacterium]
MSSKRLLTTRELAGLLGLNEVTLKVWRCLGKGPPFVRLSRKAVRYDLDDVYAWLNAQRTNLLEERR